ncbi:MAG: acyltransferase [Clostridiales bacterium]|nr:acyltransferase [Clostridiales bacterium]
MNVHSKEYTSLDIARFIAAFLVMAIHLLPFESINENFSLFFINTICRVAVPFYFMCSGFFISGAGKIRMLRYIKRLVIMYFLYTIIYFPLEVLELRIEYDTFFEATIGFVQKIIFSGSYTHLWYFPSLIFGVLLVYLLHTVFKVKNIKIIIPLIIILYVLGVIGDEFKALASSSPISKWGNLYYNIFVTTRNGLFFAFPLIECGYLIREKIDFHNTQERINLLRGRLSDNHPIGV